jgi:hypothetical protein
LLSFSYLRPHTGKLDVHTLSVNGCKSIELIPLIKTERGEIHSKSQIYPVVGRSMGIKKDAPLIRASFFLLGKVYYSADSAAASSAAGAAVSAATFFLERRVRVDFLAASLAMFSL